jgi:hypothetical protein
MAQPPLVDDYEPQIIELDDDRYAELDLSHLGRPEHRRYRASERPGGVIMLKPELTDEELEERILASPRIMAAIKEAREHPERLIPYSEL